MSNYNQLALIERPQTEELSHEDKLYFRAALKECQIYQEHMVEVELVETGARCFNCQS